MQKVNTLNLLVGCALMALSNACGPSEPPGPGPGEDAPQCGGIAAIECPGAGTCEDKPRDGCHPDRGGADCPGVCECNAIGLCVDGMVWDSSPHVCDCVPADYDPCIATLCPVGTVCENQDGEGVCVAQDAGAGGEPCGDTYCGEGMVCCNASCGICTEPDGVCIQIACE
jgi:hypothetical protein